MSSSSRRRMPPKQAGLPLGSFRAPKGGSVDGGGPKFVRDRRVGGREPSMSSLQENLGEEEEEEEEQEETEKEECESYEGQNKEEMKGGELTESFSFEKRSFRGLSSLKEGELGEIKEEESEGDDDEGSTDVEESSDYDSEEGSWSVLVRLVSAVDLPPSIVPSSPLCPMFKLGLITSKSDLSSPAVESDRTVADWDDGPETDRDEGSGPRERASKSKNVTAIVRSRDRSSILALMETSGLCSIPKARVRCSSGKILSSRDNGAAEWHEEMRWDGVRRPLQTVLAVELCARAVLPPPPPPPSPAASGGGGDTDGTGTITPPSLEAMISSGSSGAGVGSGDGAETSSVSSGPFSSKFGLAEERADAHPLLAKNDSAGSGFTIGSSPDDDTDYRGRDIEMDSLGGDSGSHRRRVSAPTPPVAGGVISPSSAQRSRSAGMGFGLNNLLPNNQDDPSQQQGGLVGLRSMFRKGRQQLAEQRQARTRGTGKPETASQNEMEAASAAAAVARFIMEKHQLDEDQGGAQRQQQQQQQLQEPQEKQGQQNDEPVATKRKEGRSGQPANYVDSDTESDEGSIGWPERQTKKSDNVRKRNEAGDTEMDTYPQKNREMVEKNLLGYTDERRRDSGRDIKLPARKKRKVEMVEDLRLGSLIIPLSRLPLENATCGNGSARIEQWYQLDGNGITLSPAQDDQLSSGGRSGMRGLSPRRNPSVLLEITFASPDILDESEDELNEMEGSHELNWDLDGTSKPRAEEGGLVSEGQRGPQTRLGMGGKMASPSMRFGTDDIGFHSSMKSLHGADEALKQVDSQTTEQPPDKKKKDLDDPVLEPGVVDYICVVGARDIGNQRNDDGSKGWVNSTPECCVLEQFPKNDEFHTSHGRFVALPNKVEWFCFPEGCKLWRGTNPPTAMDLNLKRFSAASPPNVASSIASFDACLNCTTSFSWFVISSHTDEYGSKNKKTYGAVIRFYAPAPTGIDPTQDDYAQTIIGGIDKSEGNVKTERVATKAKRLWVPLGICMTSNLPIVGILQSMLLRLCETLASVMTTSSDSSAFRCVSSMVQNELVNLIVNYQSPIAGVVHTSIPFLYGQRFHVTLPPRNALPPIPHGASITSVCRLLGAEGLTVLLAAVLTECKILMHSSDAANLAMVAEVVTALTYPFSWDLPYIPVLPEAMLEFVEAPLSYLLGVPTCNMKLIDPSVLSEIVVIDLDNGFSRPDYFDGRRGMRGTRLPTPLPASVASNISKAVFRLLREEDEVEEQYGTSTFAETRILPHLEPETLAEREFRIAVALQICGLLRGYQDCLFIVSAAQPVFNRDRFLRNAPALFEERKSVYPTLAAPPGFNSSVKNFGAGSNPAVISQRVLSPRSKRFLSLLVNTQLFHQLLERLDGDECAFFHEVMDKIESVEDRADEQSGNIDRSIVNTYTSSKLEEIASRIRDSLQKAEDKIPTYHVNRKEQLLRTSSNAWSEEDDEMNGFGESMERYDNDNDFGVSNSGGAVSSFTTRLLQPIVIDVGASHSDVPQRRDSLGNDSTGSGHSEGVRSLSVQYLVELEKSPWRYCKLFDIPNNENDEILSSERKSEEGDSPNVDASRNVQHMSGEDSEDSLRVVVKVLPKVKLKDAIGERRYRAWKLTEQQKQYTAEESLRLSSLDLNAPDDHSSLDLTTLLSSVQDDMPSEPHDNHVGSSAGSRYSSPEQQHLTDTKDKDIVRRCLERTYESTQHHATRFSDRASGSGTQMNSFPFSFQEDGHDLVSEAEAALRNPAAQRFLVSVLSQRTRLENQRKRRNEHHVLGGRHRQSNQGGISRLQPVAFECLVRLCFAMLEACMQEQNYEAAYQLLTHTAGFCTVMNAYASDLSNASFSKFNDESSDHNSKLIYMTARIIIHPIFSDLRLWERVVLLHQQDRQNDRNATNSGNGIGSGMSTLTEGRTENQVARKENSDVVEYEAAVSTLYEMLGYGVPAEELAKFATRVSEERGWFASERGKSLLVLARRLGVRRDEGDVDGPGGTVDLDLMGTIGHASSQSLSLTDGIDTVEHVGETGHSRIGGGILEGGSTKMQWEKIGWFHPSAPNNPNRSSLSQHEADVAAANAKQGIPRGSRSGGYSLLGMLGGAGLGGSQPMYSNLQIIADQSGNDGGETHSRYRSTTANSWGDFVNPQGYIGRTAVTSLASFGSSVVATGGLDGSVFLAHTIRFQGNKSHDENADDVQEQPVRGVRLEWGSFGSRGTGVGSTSSVDGELGVGAVSCLAAARGAGYRHGNAAFARPGVAKISDEEEFLLALEGCRIVAGTTGGDLRVWSVKDVYAATVVASGREGSSVFDSSSAVDAVSASMADMGLHVHGNLAEGASSSHIRSSGGSGVKRSSIYDVAGSGSSASSRLKYSLRGRALSGHRGGVTCVDVPSHIYRPDSLVSGGADGLIKLWSLRQPTNRRSNTLSASVGSVAARHSMGNNSPSASRIFGGRQPTASPNGPGVDTSQSREKNALGTEPQVTMSGHGGRVLCVKTAWHGDGLLSGGADKTVRLWDLSGSGGKCLNTLSGHAGWVTHARYWGPHTIVSTSTDRTIALWDTRVGMSPLFIIRYHRSPVSDLLVGSRSEPLMVSAGGDGAIATWDFRALSGTGERNPTSSPTISGRPLSGRRCKIVREPVTTMNHSEEEMGFRCSGSILLARGAGSHERSVLSTSIDGMLKEWDIQSGRLLGEQPTGHSDAASCLATFMESDCLRRTAGVDNGGDTRTSSVGGTISCSWDGTILVRRLVQKHDPESSSLRSSPLSVP